MQIDRTRCMRILALPLAVMSDAVPQGVGSMAQRTIPPQQSTMERDTVAAHLTRFQSAKFYRLSRREEPIKMALVVETF